MTAIALRDLLVCFQGLIPATLMTCSAEGIPNVSFISHVVMVDDHHVAISSQFLNKTQRNLRDNPQAVIRLVDLAVQTYELDVRYVRSERAGALYDAMNTRLRAIALQTEMADVFDLKSAEVFAVAGARRFDGEFAVDPYTLAVETSLNGPATFPDLRALQRLSARINAMDDLDRLLETILALMAEMLGFDHSFILLPGENPGTFETVASRGYPTSGVGANVSVGEGILGSVAQAKKPLRLCGLMRALMYGRSTQDTVAVVQPRFQEIPLPGLPDAQSLLAAPLLVQDDLVGILVLESREQYGFTDDDQVFLSVLADHLAIAVQRSLTQPPAEEPLPETATAAPAIAGETHHFTYYLDDECMLVDGEYLVRSTPARILWKLLQAYCEQGRREFTNRELRLDASLQLPAYKDNLESRLILLRKRLAEKCPDVRLAPVARGRFELAIATPIVLACIPNETSPDQRPCPEPGMAG